ncbi:hypothetical protein ACRAKI_23610 [Saccharothrix isguenensis]
MRSVLSHGGIDRDFQHRLRIAAPPPRGPDRTHLVDHHDEVDRTLKTTVRLADEMS